MADTIPISEARNASFRGLRMTAGEFLDIPDDGLNYELIDGVVQVSPSPEPRHQEITGEVHRQLANYLVDHPVGKAWPELDVHLGAAPSGGDLVYRPEIVFVRSDRLAGMKERISGAPDLVVEVVSRGSRRLDTQTKRDDYERHGVAEYWIMDPERREMQFLRLQDGKYAEVEPRNDSFASEAVPGFALDVKRVRAIFDAW